MNIIFLIFCSILSVELFIKCKFFNKTRLYINYLQTIKKNIFSKNISDKKKEIMLKKNLFELPIKTINLLLLLIWVLLPFILFIILDYYLKFNFFNFLSSYKVILMSIIFLLLYGKIRNYVFK